MKKEEFNDSKIMKDHQTKMREEIGNLSGLSSKEEDSRDLRPAIEKMIKDLPHLDSAIMCLAIAPLMLEPFKEFDPEFYYVTRSKITAFADSLMKWNKRIVDSLDHTKEKKSGPDTAKN